MAEGERLNLFRPFPDSETAELALLHLENRRVIGLQIKTVGIGSGHSSGTVSVLESSLRLSPSTYFVVVAWLRDEGRFHDEYLLIPSENVPWFADEDAFGHLKFEFHPGSTLGRFNQFRRRLPNLKDDIRRLLD